VHIREYRPQDFNSIWRLDQECFAPGIAYSRFELMHYIRRRGAFTLVAENDRGICGFLVAERRSGIRMQNKPPAAGHIITIDVSQAARRSGIGNDLMAMAERRLSEAGCDIVYLEVAVNNAAALEFYKQRGYAVLQVIPRYYDEKIDALVMGKKLQRGS
jgi:ribosomal-protein-alanine N-acetyltransferase